MKTMSYTESRKRYAEVLDSVVKDREEVVITRSGQEPVVIVSVAEFESLRRGVKLFWDEKAQDRKTPKRLNLLIRDIVRNGNEGIGTPEPLKRDFADYWVAPHRRRTPSGVQVGRRGGSDRRLPLPLRDVRAG